MAFQFGAMRETICAPQLSVGSGNLTTSGTLFFWLQGRNDVGYNLPSSPAEVVTYTAGQSILITLPGDCYRSGENILQYAISVNTVDNASTATVLLNLDRKNLSLPTTIVLSEDAHLLSAQTVASFPQSTSLINGLLRELASTGLVYRYNAFSTQPADGLLYIAASSGNWEYHYDGFSSFVSNTAEDSNGCNLSVLDIVDSKRVIPKYYALDGGIGDARIFWLKNDTSETIDPGVRIGLTVSINGEPASEEFESLLKVVFDGYVDSATGFLDTLDSDGLSSMEDVGITKSYQFGRTDLILQKPLLPGQAYQLRVFPQFNAYELQAVPQSGSTIAVLGFFFDEAGSYNDASAFIGNAILPENPELRRVYPSSGLSVLAEEGSGTVAGFFFKDIGRNTIPGLNSNEAGQTIVINNNGTVYLKTDPLDSNEALRALVGTVAGESMTSAFSILGLTANDSPDLTITINYPGQIDSDYDDVIAGEINRGAFNAEEVVLYVRKNGNEIRKFSGLAPTNSTSDTFTVSWSAGTVVPTINTIPFGLFRPNTPSSIAATTTGINTFEAACGFVYLGNSVTSISHKESDGCIAEFLLSLADLSTSVIQLLESSGYWKQPVGSYSALKQLSISSLKNGQSNRVKGGLENTYEIWTWDAESLAISDDISYIRPNEISSDASPGRWIKVSGGGTSSTEFNVDNIVTAYGEVVVGSDGYVVTSDLGGPVTALPPYTARNIVTGVRQTLNGNLTLTDQTPYVYSLDSSLAVEVALYNGGEFFRNHLFINKGTFNIAVSYNAVILTTLAPGQQASLLFDTENWILI